MFFLFKVQIVFYFSMQIDVKSSKVKKYLNSDTVFVIVHLYTMTMDLKFNNQNVIKV